MDVLYRLRFDDKDYRHDLSARTVETAPDGTRTEVYRRFLDTAANSGVVIMRVRDREFPVSRLHAEFFNFTDRPVRLYALDVGFPLDADPLDLHYFTSDWGSEFFPQRQRFEGSFEFASVAGRSSKGFIPWAGLAALDRGLAVALAWSGCWTCRIDREGGRAFFSMGHSAPDFFIDVAPGATFAAADLLVGEAGTLEDASLALRRYFRARLGLAKELPADLVPIEYNGWWPHEDKFLTEDLFVENARLAKELGCRYATMDAGWFGYQAEGQGWYEKRGDWDVINTRDFPSGMKSLCDRVARLDILPGLWCEIEAVGKDAALLTTHPGIIARRDGKSLGYVCLADPTAYVWALGVVDRILGEYGARWIKFDYNLDPAPGCNAPGHGHGVGDGLHAHYRAYYRMLDEVRRRHPGVVIENCSSGGLRCDVEMLSHVHWTFLSDPDHTEFHLQLYWGALSYLHQSALMHFSWSEVLQDHNLGVRHPISADMPRARFDYLIRAVLMGVPGFSYRLPDLPDWCRARLKELCDFYTEIHADFIRSGDAFRLTPQPLTGGQGERFPVFEFLSVAKDAVVFAFRLQGAPEERTVRLQGLVEEGVYDVLHEDSGRCERLSGRELHANGISFRNLPESGSEIVRIRLDRNEAKEDLRT
jgi:alpha-galactosidase